MESQLNTTKKETLDNTYSCAAEAKKLKEDVQLEAHEIEIMEREAAEVLKVRMVCFACDLILCKEPVEPIISQNAGHVCQLSTIVDNTFLLAKLIWRLAKFLLSLFSTEHPLFDHPTFWANW